MASQKKRASVVLGIDIGSTNTKVVALDEDGIVVARTGLPTPRNPDGTITPLALIVTIEEMILEACGDRFMVEAVAAAGIGEDGVLVDRALTPLVPALAWFDARRGDIFAELEPRLPPATGTGVATEASRTLSGWVWAQSQPGAAAATAWIALTDFTASHWSGIPFMSDTLAARTAAWNVERREWIADRVTATLGRVDLLPPVRSGGEIVGPLRSQRLREAGVLGRNPVVASGGHDHPIGAWGVIRMHAGAILDSMGTAEVVVAHSLDTGADRGPGIDVSPAVRGSGTTLLTVRELTRNVYTVSEEEPVGVALRAMMAGTLQPNDWFDSDCFIPGGQGGLAPRFDDGAPADPVSRASAVMGALARLGAQAVETIAAQVSPHAAIYVAGGWARAEGWLAAKRRTCATGFRVVAEPEVTAVGAALLAAETAGWSVSAESALTPEERPADTTRIEPKVKRFWT